jgi:hypothetical protein
MTDDTETFKAQDPLDDLVHELLECGAVLSQMISGMVEFEASGRAVPDTAPIPEIAHDLIRSVSTDVRHGFSRRDIKVAARMVKQVTAAICSDIFYVPPEQLDRLLAEEPDAEDEE